MTARREGVKASDRRERRRGGYADLVRTAERFEVFDTTIQVASLADIIRSKAAADRPQDRQDIPILEAMMRRKEGR